jgi:hypothetical protein
MIITLMIPNVWNFINEEKNNLFLDLWKTMWFDEDYSRIMKYIEEEHKKYNNK